MSHLSSSNPRLKPSNIVEVRARKLDSEARIRLYGPEPINPFFTLRDNAGLNLGDLSAYTGIDQRALRRCEHGMYTAPLPNLMQYWIKRGTATEGQMAYMYYDYQDAQRARHYRYFGDLLTGPDFDPNIHPFRSLRFLRPSMATNLPLPVGLTECCQALCLPLDTVQFFEKKYRLQQSVPKTILNVLNQIGYTRPEITEFEEAYNIFRSVSKVRVS